MKKFLPMLMSAILLLSSCGGKEIPVSQEEPEKTTETTETTETSSETQEKERVELMPEEGAELTFWAKDEPHAKGLAAAFEEKYGVPVTVEIVGFEVPSKMLLEAPSGNGADVAWINHDALRQLSDAGVISTIDSSITDKMEEELLPTASKSFNIDGEYYGVPFGMETTAYFYNKDIVDTPASTIEEIMEEAQSFNVPEENKFYLVHSPTGFFMSGILSAFGFELHGADGNDNDNPGYDSEALLEALAFLPELKEVLPVSSEDLKMNAAALMQQNFTSGNVAYMIGGPWVINTLDEAGVNYGIMPMPTIKGNDMKPFANITGIIVNDYTQYPNAAQLFAQFASSEKGAQILFDAQKGISPRKDYEKIEGLVEDEIIMGLVKQMENTVPTPTASRINYYWTIADSVFGAVFDGDLTPEEGQAKFVADYEALVASE